MKNPNKLYLYQWNQKIVAHPSADWGELASEKPSSRSFCPYHIKVEEVVHVLLSQLLAAGARLPPDIPADAPLVPQVNFQRETNTPARALAACATWCHPAVFLSLRRSDTEEREQDRDKVRLGEDRGEKRLTTSPPLSFIWYDAIVFRSIIITDCDMIVITEFFFCHPMFPITRTELCNWKVIQNLFEKKTNLLLHNQLNERDQRCRLFFSFIYLLKGFTCRFIADTLELWRRNERTGKWWLSKSRAQLSESGLGSNKNNAIEEAKGGTRRRTWHGAAASTEYRWHPASVSLDWWRRHRCGRRHPSH
jgi:hypothetical protein